MTNPKHPNHTEALKSFIEDTHKDKLEALAVLCGTSVGHLKNCANGSRGVSPKLALQLEIHSRRKVTRKMLCADWEDIWPELKKRKK